MSYSVLKFVIFLVCFGVSFYACSAIEFQKFMKVREPRKVVFLLSLSLAYVASQAILELTIYNGFGG